MKVRMKPLTRFTVTILLLSFYYAAAQDIPEGVNYKVAPKEINALAKSILEQALANPDKPPSELFGDVVVCGAMLWKSLKPTADRVLLESKPIIIGLSVPEPIEVEGRRIITKEEQESFWRVFMAKFTKLKGGTVRKGKADEISYYWETIPFDIEEPFYVIDTGTDRFVANFKVEDGKPRLFWIDLVGDLRILKP